jgi:hypothetical protein
MNLCNQNRYSVSSIDLRQFSLAIPIDCTSLLAYISHQLCEQYCYLFEMLVERLYDVSRFACLACQ